MKSRYCSRLRALGCAVFYYIHHSSRNVAFNLNTVHYCKMSFIFPWYSHKPRLMSTSETLSHCITQLVPDDNRVVGSYEPLIAAAFESTSALFSGTLKTTAEAASRSSTLAKLGRSALVQC